MNQSTMKKDDKFDGTVIKTKQFVLWVEHDEETIYRFELENVANDKKKYWH